MLKKAKKLGKIEGSHDFQYGGAAIICCVNFDAKVQSADLTCDVIKKVAPQTVVLNLQTE